MLDLIARYLRHRAQRAATARGLAQASAHAERWSELVAEAEAARLRAARELYEQHPATRAA